MEIRPIKPVLLDPEQNQGRIANRQPGAAHHYAGTPVVDEVDEFSFNKLLKLADTALTQGNAATALEQYAKILTYEPNNFRALYGKILAEGWQSPADLSETLGKLDALLKRATNAELAVSARAGGDIIALGQKAEAEALTTLLKEITPAAFALFATRMEQVLTLYQNSAQMLPTHEGMLLAMITASERLMVPYRDRKSGRKFHPPKGMYEKGKEWLQKARELLKKRFPSRLKRLMLYKKYQTCFVATAAWGDPTADEVMDLRTFRDLYLRTNSMGRRFIVFYYRHGAVAAGIIAERSFLRKGVRGMLGPVLWGVKLLPGIRRQKTP